MKWSEKRTPVDGTLRRLQKAVVDTVGGMEMMLSTFLEKIRRKVTPKIISVKEIFSDFSPNRIKFPGKPSQLKSNPLYTIKCRPVEDLYIAPTANSVFGQ